MILFSNLVSGGHNSSFKTWKDVLNTMFLAFAFNYSLEDRSNIHVSVQLCADEDEQEHSCLCSHASEGFCVKVTSEREMGSCLCKVITNFVEWFQQKGGVLAVSRSCWNCVACMNVHLVWRLQFLAKNILLMLLFLSHIGPCVFQTFWWHHTSIIDKCFCFLQRKMDAYDCRLPLGGILSIHKTPEWLYGLGNVIRV